MACYSVLYHSLFIAQLHAVTKIINIIKIKHVVTRMRKLVSQNGGQKHYESVEADIFVLHLHRFITIRLNVGKLDIRRFEVSVNQLA